MIVLYKNTFNVLVWQKSLRVHRRRKSGQGISGSMMEIKIATVEKRTGVMVVKEIKKGA